MAKYDLELRGIVGYDRFNARQVRDACRRHEGKRMDVLIDSPGGSYLEGASISAMFRDHGDVHVHFVAVNASAATLASMGAKEITIAPDAMYMVHQCSMFFFDWGSKNADEYRELIRDAEKTARDLDKYDLTAARMYATRCKRKPEELLELMHREEYLSADEALEWGFVDRIVSNPGDAKMQVTEEMKAVLAYAGLPLPHIEAPVSGEKETPLQRILSTISDFFKPDNNMSKEKEKPAVGNEAPAEEKPAAANDAEVKAEEESPAKEEEKVDPKLSAALERINALEKKLARLEQDPAEDTSGVVSSGRGKEKDDEEDEAPDAFKAFTDITNSTIEMLKNIK